MKSATTICSTRDLALTVVFTLVLAGCDGGSTALITGPATTAALESDIAQSDAVEGNTAQADVVGSEAGSADEIVQSELETDTLPDNTIDETTTVIGEPVSQAVDSVFVQNDLPDNDASSGGVAAAFLADRTALGAIKIMAVGDSITHGVFGGSSYRKQFTSLMDTASCEYTMVGSQTSSLAAGNNSTCIDTGVIGDGWGWNGSESCIVDNNTGSADELFLGAHEGYSANRIDHFLTGNDSSAGNNEGIRVAVQNFNPDVILLHLGSVDLYNQQSLASTVSEMDDLLNAIFETKPDVLVLIANVIPWFSDKPYAAIGEDVQLLGDGIQEIVAERFDPLIKLVDVRTGFTESMMMDDLIHPNVAGEAHIAESFMDAYQSLAGCG